MENRSQNNNLIFMHLPGLFNMLQIMNMMLFGLVVNQPSFFIMAVNNLQESIQLTPKMNWKRWLTKKVYPGIRIAYYLTLTVSVAFVLLSNSSSGNALFIITSIALLALVTQVGFIIRCLMSANRALIKNHSHRLFYCYHRYKIPDILGFISLLIAVISG